MSCSSTRRAPLAAALPLALALLAACSSPATSSASRTGLLVSDLHFNPLAHPALAEQLIAAPIAQWDAILAASPDLTYSQAGHDTNHLLLQSSLAAMKAQAPSPDVVFLTGDLLVHGLSAYFAAAAVRDPSPAAFQAFASKTEAYLALELSRTFPDAQIVPTLGDWDQLGWASAQADPAFLEAFAAAWSPLVDRLGGAPDLQATFPGGGYFSTAFPVDPHGRLLVLYTQPWAQECSGCTADAGSTGALELEWLAAQLADARAQGQRVWLLGHIPPGISAPPTAAAAAGGAACPDAVQPYYAEPFATQLLALYQEYGDVIRFGLFAHEHLDDFRLLRDAAGSPLFGMKLVPSISPLHGNAPAFVRFTYDPDAGAMTDAVTYRLTNLPLATTAVPGDWAEEYGFDQIYGQARLDADGVADAVARIQAGGAAREAYQAYYASSDPAGNPAGGFTPFQAYGCALDRLSIADFTACYCGR